MCKDDVCEGDVCVRVMCEDVKVKLIASCTQPEVG